MGLSSQGRIIGVSHGVRLGGAASRGHKPGGGWRAHGSHDDFTASPPMRLIKRPLIKALSFIEEQGNEDDLSVS